MHGFFLFFDIFLIKMNQKLTDFIDAYFSSITAFNIRFAQYIMKIDENLDQIASFLKKPSDNVESVIIEREKRIAIEFSRRFTRDQLYPIQIDISRIQKAYLIFVANENCKMAQSTTLRPLVLSILKKLCLSVRLYYRFLRNNKTKLTVKLKEILNLLSHFISIVKSIVDHQVLKSNDIEEKCIFISNLLNNQKKECSFFKNDRKIRKETIKPIIKCKQKFNPKTIVPSKLCKNKHEINPKNQMKHLTKKNINRFQSGSKCINILGNGIKFISPKKNEVITTKNSSNKHKQFITYNSVTDICSRLSEIILNELFDEVILEINQCLQEIVNETFDLEF